LATTNVPKTYFFIDESGDPNFFAKGKKLLIGKSGYQPYLIIGMIETNDRRALHDAVSGFMNEIKSNPSYNIIPSVAEKKGWYVHARGDHPLVRKKFFELLKEMDCFKAHIVIGRKDLDIFNQKHNGNSSEFYFDLLHHLLSSKLNEEQTEYNLYLSQRGNNTIHRFNNAVVKAIENDNRKKDKPLKVNYQLGIVSNTEMPELSIVDYMIWAIQRRLLLNENHYFDMMKDKFETVIDLYGK